MTPVSDSFQVFVKPVGSRCNLSCGYCYYSSDDQDNESCMSPRVLEAYIGQHLEVCPDPVVLFSWHGGEPTLAGLEFFRNVVRLQHKFKKPGQKVLNGVQTNGSLLDDRWCRFFAEESFLVGLSMDGPSEFHDIYRRTRSGKPVADRVLNAYHLLKKHSVPTEILCVVHAGNVGHPLEVYSFFRGLGAEYLTFLPYVARSGTTPGSVSPGLVAPGSVASVSVPSVSVPPGSVPPEAWGHFLCSIFDRWMARDIGKIKVQIFEEVLRTAFGLEHSLCVFRPVCGRVPVVEKNGDFYCCDHFVNNQHLLGNILSSSLGNLLEDPRQQDFGLDKSRLLPQYCRDCAVLDMCAGGCPKDRFIATPDGEAGLNYLCTGYKKFFLHARPFVDEVARVFRETHSGN